jgi:hypothetical protein
MKCKSVLYLEGHGNQPRSKYFKYILDNTDFTQVEHVGCYEGRDLFRCSREVLGRNGFHLKFNEVRKRYVRIGVVGNQLTGKSTLCREMRHPSLGWSTLDDCDDLGLIGSCGKLVLFDYMAAQYADDLDVVFNVLQSAGKFEFRRKKSAHLRSSEIASSETLCCLYTVRMC